MDAELVDYFPDKFTDSETLEFYYKMYARMESELVAMLDPSKIEEAEKIRKETDEYFSTIHKPRRFDGKDSFSLYQEHAFEDLICVLEDNGTPNARDLTTFEFFKRAEFYEKKFRTQTT